MPLPSIEGSTTQGPSRKASVGGIASSSSSKDPSAASSAADIARREAIHAGDARRVKQKTKGPSHKELKARRIQQQTVELKRRDGFNMGMFDSTAVTQNTMKRLAGMKVEEYTDEEMAERERHEAEAKMEAHLATMTLHEQSGFLLSRAAKVDVPLALPLGLKHKPLGQETLMQFNGLGPAKSSSSSSSGVVATALPQAKTHGLDSGLPGLLSLSEKTTNKYFGSNARFNFFERHHWLQRQKAISCADSSRCLDGLLFDNERSNEDVARMQPFGAFREPRMLHRRSGKLTSEEEINDYFRLRENEKKSGVEFKSSPVAPAHDFEKGEEEDIFAVELDKPTSLLALDASCRLPSSKRHNSDSSRSSLHPVEMHLQLLSSLAEDPLSPRSQYLDGCSTQSLLPRPSLLVRKTFSKRLALQHKGIGDEMAKILAGSIASIPYIQSINLEDNGLTDEGLGPLLEAIMTIPDLLELNVSQNVLNDVSSDCLFRYLSSEACPLRKLTLRKADIDDYECANFIEAVKANKSLRELVLSNNLIGSAENLNTVFPDFTTGSEAIADLLGSGECRLVSLALDWNMIRLDGAVALANSLNTNCVLTDLDISFNSLGHDGGIALGGAIYNNKTLKTLNVANNGIDACGCFTISAGVLENRCLTSVNLNGNPIAIQGSKALMLVPLMAGNRVTITAEGCNITIYDGACWFDHSRPVNEVGYDLNMEDPFERAIAMVLLHIVASHHSYILKSCEVVTSPDNPKLRRVESVELVSEVTDEKKNYFDVHQQEVYNQLQRVQDAASDIKNAVSLFQEIDKDGSGELDKKELGLLLDNMGLNLSEERLEEMFNMYDTDEGGTIEMPEFLLFIKSMCLQAQARAKDLVESPQLVLKSDRKTRWLPPQTGRVLMTLEDGFTSKDVHKVLSSADKQFLETASKGTGDNAFQMLSRGLEGVKLRVDEAIGVMKIMQTEMNDKKAILALLLPQLLNPGDARSLINSALGKNRTEFARLRREVGAALRPLLGAYGGYYCLDMAKQMDRFCLSRLLEISQTINHSRKKACRMGLDKSGNYSQKGNWSCFRNETFQGSPVTINNAFATPIPLSGKLEFDFIGDDRPTKESVVFSDLRVLKLCINNFIMTPAEAEAEVKPLRRAKLMGDKCLDCDGHTIFKCSLGRALKISELQAEFYGHLDERLKAVQDMGFQNSKEVGSHSAAGAVHRRGVPAGRSFQAQLAEDEDEDVAHGEKEDEEMSLSTASSVDESDSSSSEDEEGGGEEEEAAELSSQQGRKASPFVPKELDEYMRKTLAYVSSSHVSKGAKAAKIVELITDALYASWVCARHVAVIMRQFKLKMHGGLKATAFFGTYRVELLCQIFSRIADLHNIEIVLKELTPFEAACLYSRVGWLSIYNPCKPEGSYELDLGRREERIVAKTLCVLATSEPGDNWPFQQFRWNRAADPMPGWELTQPWMTDSGMPQKGLLTITYYSGECKFLSGCRPNINCRKAMLSLVALEESELIEEEARTKPRSGKYPGVAYMLANKATYLTYLTAD